MTWKLYYDGGCNLCHVAKLRAEAWAERAGQPLVVDILQSPEAIEKGYADAMVLEADRVYTAADAWFKMMTIAPWYLRWVSWFRLTPPTYWVARLIYGLVARLRYRLFGRRACPLPGAAGR
jgi:predicted DCC family thiol-disulfide oxidoreductase YuxK